MEKTRHRVRREPYGIVYTEEAGFKDTYGGVEGIVFLEAHRLVPEGVESDTVLLFMHPIGGGAYLPMVSELAKQGNHVIYANSRYRGDDSALIMENVVTDLGAALRDAKERFGYSRVVLAGWSGGGALSLYYQSIAEDKADAMLLLAAHPSRSRVLLDSIDPSVVDESDPDTRDPALNLYGRSVEPPYSEEFLARYRDAQLARMRRISAWVRSELERRGPNEERGFVVHGTMADPKCLDPSIDPNEREPGTSFLGDPRIVNDGPVGLARFSTLRSWLSQWSIDDSRADGIAAAANVTVPALVVVNGADNVCTPSYGQMMFDALASPEKELHTIAGANHYYIGGDQLEKLRGAAELCTDWLSS
jgi:pimeloyl-ACP methyl ester carboxylesterase